MSRLRPESIDHAAQVRAATLWAIAFSAGAAVGALAVPLIILHAAAFIDGRSDATAFGAITLFALALLIVRGAFLTARTRVLSRTALWLGHALGADTLARGLETVASPNDLARDRAALNHVVATIPSLAVIGDTVAVVIPLAALLMMLPQAAALTAVATCAMLGILAHTRPLLERDLDLADLRRVDADAAWMTAAASSVVIAARGMTPATVNEWQALDTRAVARGFAADRCHERAQSMTGLVRHVSMAAAAVVAAFTAAGDPVVAVATTAAVMLLHDAVLLPFVALVRGLAALLTARRNFGALKAPATASILTMPISPAAAHVPQGVRTHRRAEAS